MVDELCIVNIDSGRTQMRRILAGTFPVADVSLYSKSQSVAVPSILLFPDEGKIMDLH